MYRAFTYSLYPTKAQAKYLNNCLRVTRGLYNAALAERKEAWEAEKKSISRIDQQKALTRKRKIDPELALIPVMLARGSLRRVERGFQGFFRRVKAGEKKVGYPRFKGANRWDSLFFDELQTPEPIIKNRVKIPGIGKVKAKIHRPLEGTPKTLTLKLKAGHWYACIGCDDVPMKPLPATGKSIGVDLGLIHYAATSDGDTFDNPRPYKKAEKRLARAQRRISRRKIGSNRRRKAVLLYQKQATHVANVRREFQIKEIARFLVKHYDHIYIEDLSIKGLARGWLSKSVHDAAWGNCLHWLSVKAEEAGRNVTKVDPRGTSQMCSGCEKIVEKTLKERVHRCDCGLTLDRDVNAARNILRAGLVLQGEAAAVSAPRRSVKSA